MSEEIETVDFKTEVSGKPFNCKVKLAKYKETKELMKKLVSIQTSFKSNDMETGHDALEEILSRLYVSGDLTLEEIYSKWKYGQVFSLVKDFIALQAVPEEDKKKS